MTTQVKLVLLLLLLTCPVFGQIEGTQEFLEQNKKALALKGSKQSFTKKSLGKLPTLTEKISTATPLTYTSTDFEWSKGTKINLKLKDIKSQYHTFSLSPRSYKIDKFKTKERIKYAIKYLDITCGLPANRITAICKDDQENIWIGYNGGLAKINSRFIHIYDVKAGLPDAHFVSLSFHKGKLFAGTFGSGLFIIQNNTCYQYNKTTGFPTDLVLSFESVGDQLLIGTYGEGLIIRESGKFKLVQNFASKPDSPYRIISDITTNNKNILLIASRGLIKVDLAQRTATTYSSSDYFNGDEFTVGSMDEQGTLYLSSRDHFLYRLKANGQLDKFPTYLESYGEVREVVIGRSGAPWLATSKGGIIGVFGEYYLSISKSDGLTDNVCNHIIQDKFDNLWIATDNEGLDLLTPSNFTNVMNSESHTSGLAISGNGELIFENPESGGLTFQKGKSKTTYLSKVFGSTKSLAIHPKTHAVFAVSGGILYELNNGELYEYDMLIDGFDGVNLLHVSIAKDGTLWLSDYNYGVLRLSVTGRLEKYNELVERGFSLCYSIVPTADGAWALGDAGNLAHFSKDGITHYQIEFNNIPLKTISGCFLEQNQLAIGTSAGLFVLRRNEFEKVRLPIEMRNERIQSLLYEPVNKSLWLATPAGLAELNKKTNRFYNELSGLQSSYFYVNSVTSDKNGHVYWATAKAIIEYIPFEFSNQTLSRSINIEAISLLGENRTWDQLKQDNLVNFESMNGNIPVHLSVPQFTYDIIFQIGSKNWGRESQTRYYYRLPSAKVDSWTYFGNDGDLLLEDLPGGEHQLQIKAEIMATGETNVLNYVFEIKKPFYLETWFGVVTVVFLLVILWMFLYRSSNFSFLNYISLSDSTFLLTKARVLAIASLIIIVGIDYYQSEIAHRFYVYWPVNIALAIHSTVVFLYTYSRNVRIRFLEVVISITFLVICFVYAHRAYVNDFEPALSLELAMCYLFSVLIFKNLKSIFVFVVFVVALSAYFIGISSADLNGLSIFASVSVQTLLCVIIFSYIEHKKLNKVLFSDTILNSSEQFILVSNAQGEIVYVNDYALEQTGFKLDEVLGNGWWESKGLSPDDVVEQKALTASKIRKNQSQIYTSEYYNRNTNQKGVIRWKDSPLQGKFMIGLGFDITQEEHTQREVRKFSVVAEKVRNGILIADLDWNVSWSNASLNTILGRTILPGDNVNQYFNDLNFDDIQEKNKKARQEIRIVNDLGEIKWLLVDATISNDIEEDKYNVIVIVTDITVRKTLEIKTEYLINNAGDIIFTCNLDGEFTFLNESLTNMLGYENKKLVGQHFTKIIHPEDVQRVVDFYKNQFAQRLERTVLEFRVLAQNRKVHYVSQVVNFTYDGYGKIDGVQAVVRDITELKTIESERKKIQEEQVALNQILATYSMLEVNDDDEFGAWQASLLSTISDKLHISRVSLWNKNEEGFFRIVSNAGETRNLGLELDSVKPNQKSFPLFFQALEREKILVASDVYDNDNLKELYPFFEENNVLSSLHLGIMRNGELSGVLAFAQSDKRILWTDQLTGFARSIGDLILSKLEAISRKKIESAIRESENNFRLLNETIGDAFWLIDLEKGLILYISAMSKEIFGYNPEEFYTTVNLWEQYVYEEDRVIVENAHKTFNESGHYSIQYRINHPTKGVRWIYEKSNGITNNEGVWIKSSGISTDITEQKESEKTIERLSQVARKTNNIIVISDTKGRIEWVNETFEQLTEFSFNEVIGKKPGSFLQGEDTDPETVAKLSEAIRDRKSIRTEILNYTKSGVPYWIELAIDPVFNDAGELVNFIAVNTEISERKLREELIQAQNDDILAGINYAKRIQQALFPSQRYLEALPVDFEYFNRPRDIIGGDFFWIHREKERLYIATGDCTGHGVPGALMTSFAINGLQNAVSEQYLTSPAAILHSLEAFLVDTLHIHDNDQSVRDGLDLGIVCLNFQNNTASFSGAIRPLLYIQDGQLHKVDGIRKSIGTPELAIKFEDTIIPNMDAITFYMYSDGITDQYGTNNKKMGSPALRKILQQGAHLDLAAQKVMMLEQLEKFQGHIAQTDDIIWTAFKIKKA